MSAPERERLAAVSNGLAPERIRTTRAQVRTTKLYRRDYLSEVATIFMPEKKDGRGENGKYKCAADALDCDGI